MGAIFEPGKIVATTKIKCHVTIMLHHSLHILKRVPGSLLSAILNIATTIGWQKLYHTDICTHRGPIAQMETGDELLNFYFNQKLESSTRKTH